MVMLIVIAFTAFPVGCVTGILSAVKGMRVRYGRRHVDYRERWQSAVRLLGEQGQLTAAQVSQITAPSASGAARKGMSSWDRAHLEVGRAKAGLPPADDLEGMGSWDKRKVLEARARNGTG